MFAAWKVAELDDSKRGKATWKHFARTMQKYYKLTENLALKNHQFRSLVQGAHPGQEGLKRRLRYHFFFHGMDKKVEEFVKSASDCNVLVNKETKETIKPHQVLERCWETVAVDLFGHINEVIPALTEIYETCRNPDVYPNSDANFRQN